jgi:8-amino-7-oxononanoate synthase
VRLDDHVKATLADLERHGLRRTRTVALRPSPGRVVLAGREILDFSSNDYLGLSQHPEIVAQLRVSADLGAGGTSSRLVLGTSPAHDTAERALADLVGHPDTRLFSSAFAANVGTIPALFGPDDLLLSDELNHASLIDGCRASRARVLRYRHADADHARELLQSHRASARLACIITESLFSMDGDPAPLRELRGLADTYEAALYLDEAHALGVVGPSGRGLAAAEAIQTDILVGGLGKAFGLVGGFVSGSAALCELLDNKARSFVFSTATPPAAAALIPTAVRLVREADAPRARLQRHTADLAVALGHRRLGGAIAPVIVGEAEQAVRLSRALHDDGFVVPAIRPPTVPPGTARLRISCSAAHTSADVAHLVLALERHLGRHHASHTTST